MIKLFRLLRYDLPLHFVLLITNWLPDNVPFLWLRGFLAHFFLGSCGKNLRLGRNLTFYDPQKISIGSDVYIAYGCWITGGGNIYIGDEVIFGPYVVVVAGNHQRHPNKHSYRFSEHGFSNVYIDSGCWVASHVVIAGGSKIGKGSLIAANSVISNNEIPANHLAGGAPCKVIKYLD